ncbi:MAG: OmpA family protein, partial [Treponema sp.]|nr:OmpA family protein [Treponema sp.]
HAELLGFYGVNPVWAWTCSSGISYKTAPDGVVSITLDFPLENSQYIIITGVPTFHSQIEIQKLRFRTDPKFETYNSSGYAYDEAKKTLFLKSRHKSKTELIRLFCDPASNFMGPDDSLASMQQQVQQMGLANVSVKRTEEGLTLSVEKIQFEAESATLRESEFGKLQQIAKILKAYPNDILVSGHTAKSNIGRPAQPLSEERAEAVAEYLVQQGVRTREHIFTKGYGDTRPISPNTTEEERAVNRRVEITLIDN